ncbi:putative sterigmatocystin biosynthesis monooxygenase stcW [Cladophialophora carrionii]|uniref:Putative sterigmatocystin biosynthesis monooxygenase stcW n=1 Tax=Cladophialophora carrionii TaxID=86049 RepID=A0A1C1CLP8_9EURO|nr:putative sterigmatocystin biosynthesis monooxygenase stcW [Cladophialophora carrionii]
MHSTQPLDKDLEHQMNGLNVNGYGSGTPTNEYIIPDRPLRTKRHLRIVCIGAGVSGICLAIKLQQRMTDFDLRIYEKNADLGGTWLENRYPGCACDIPAHGYVGSVELHNYLKAVAAKHDVNKYITYNHQMISAAWQEDRSVWQLHFEMTSPEDPTARSSFTTECDVLLNATGSLNNWKWPDIPGLRDFKVFLTHSAHWEEGYDFKDKEIAVIGAGSSAIQIVPQLQPVVKHMTSFIRSPTWIAPSLGLIDPKDGSPSNFYYTDEQKREFRENPQKFLEYRKKIENEINRAAGVFIKDGLKQQIAFKVFTEYMKGRLGNDEAFAAALTPKWSVGCKRLTPGVNFLESLIKENVTVVNEAISKITAEGLVTCDGKLHKVDALVCATGFDTTYRPRFELLGRNKKPLHELWANTDDVEAYLAMMVPEFPNYFMFIGPNSPVANGSFMLVVEKQCEYVVSVLEKLQSEDIKALAVKRDITHQLNAHYAKYHERTVFSDRCRSWYKGGKVDGKVLGIWPGSSLHYYELIKNPRFEDFEFTYASNNPWSFLGDGRTSIEAEDEKQGGTLDLAWYLTTPESMLHAPGS